MISNRELWRVLLCELPVTIVSGSVVEYVSGCIANASGSPEGLQEGKTSLPENCVCCLSDENSSLHDRWSTSIGKTSRSGIQISLQYVRPTQNLIPA